jgi:hypothetical protein
MAHILLFDGKPDFRVKLESVIASTQDFVVKTRFGREDTLPTLLLDLLYRKIGDLKIEQYDLRTYCDEAGRINIKGTFEGERPG